MNKLCIRILESACNASAVRAIKTVRLSMETAGRLMMTHDNVRIVHLIRDPKSVTLSRRGDKSFRGIKSDLVSEAKMYCLTVLEDVKAREDIEAKFPNSVLQIFTDTFVRNSATATVDLYRVLQESVPHEVIDYLIKHVRFTDTSATDHPKWHDVMFHKTVSDIDEVCDELYRTLQPPWPSTYKQ